MARFYPTSFVRTVKERCRVCYTCVRECPAKAIRIADGQAEVMGERCINCGNCVRVCSQGAKQVAGHAETVLGWLAGGQRVAALVAPSFPAEFGGEYGRFVGAMRQLGFSSVHEVAFGADLVARRVARLLKEGEGRYIGTACPAIVSFVEKYHPDVVGQLAPVVSPMVAMARVIRQKYARGTRREDRGEDALGTDVRLVFVGPCIAKKQEAASEPVAGEVDAAVTYRELREMLAARGVEPSGARQSEFDGPHGGLGWLFPISRGLLQASGLTEDLLTGDVVATEGRTNFVDALKEFEAGTLDARLLEVLACDGCIMGAGMTVQSPLFRRRSEVSRYVRGRMEQMDRAKWEEDLARYEGIELSRRFVADDQRIPVPFSEEIEMIMRKMGKERPEDELNCGACGYDSCREHAVAIFKGLAETEMCLPHAIDELRRTVRELAASSEQLASTQEALTQSEKLASMGQLAAGIAHEVNNPLGVVLMYAHLLLEGCEQSDARREDLSLIAEQADRCKKIVAGLLHFARQNKVDLQATDMVDLCERGLKAVPRPESVRVRIENELEDRVAWVDADQIIQVLTNLVSNAVAAMPEGGEIVVRLGGDAERVRIAVVDTGTGIAKENLGKIFEPFYTTKQMGMGTGLGLAVTYGIVKMHYGDIAVASNADAGAGPTGTTFTVTLARQGERSAARKPTG